MRKVHCTPAVIGLAVCMASLAGGARAGEQVYAVRQNHSGFALPGVVSPNGYDEVRAADGTTCHSSISSGGSYFDTGVISDSLNAADKSLSAYGRLVIPLGERPKRLNCDRLYQLELRRLQLEVKLLEQGLDPRMIGHQLADRADWSERGGWTDAGQR